MLKNNIKTITGFSYPKNMEIFETFHWVISLNTNLQFLNSDGDVTIQQTTTFSSHTLCLMNSCMEKPKWPKSCWQSLYNFPCLIFFSSSKIYRSYIYRKGCPCSRKYTDIFGLLWPWRQLKKQTFFDASAHYNPLLI